FFSSRRRHTRSKRDWSSDVCSSDLRRPLRRPISDEHDSYRSRQSCRKYQKLQWNGFCATVHNRMCCLVSASSQYDGKHRNDPASHKTSTTGAMTFLHSVVRHVLSWAKRSTRAINVYS